MDMRPLLGMTVTDRRGRCLGIITQVTPNFEDQVMVRVWDPTMDRYLLFSKHYKSLLQVTADNWFNPEDPLFLEILRDSCCELALATNDKKWFQELNAIGTNYL